MFSIVLGQMENNYFLEQIPVDGPSSVIFSNGRNNEVIQPINCELQCQWL